jgi:NTE family protein
LPTKRAVAARHLHFTCDSVKTGRCKGLAHMNDGTRKKNAKKINLALQGGGSHGAFTWGVLDRILEDERIEIEAVSGTSAGAMNAVALAEGLVEGGYEGARKQLRFFWQSVSEAASNSPFRRSPFDMFGGGWSLDSNPGYLFFDLLSRLASPYDLNPMNLNPLRDLISGIVDFKLVNKCDSIGVFISATNVETGRVRVFSADELNCEHVVASACLPYLFQAVEIDGVPYWDGGYVSNPALFPFFETSQSSDVVIVEINPLMRKGAPRNARDILNRMNEITFNSSLMAELRAIDFVHRLMDDGRLSDTRYRRINVHMIADDEGLSGLGASSKLNAEWAFFEMLFEMGRKAADQFLDKHFADMGERSSVNLRKLFAGDGSEG